MADLRHDEVEALLGAYAIDAIDADERAAVEEHLATCPRCRAEVDSHREVAAFLAAGGAPAPDQLWDRIAGAIAGEPPPPLRLVVDDERRAGRPRRPRWFLAAAAVVIAIAAASVGILVGGGDDTDSGGELAAAALAAFESPDARTADLVDDDGRTLARVAVLDDGTGYVLADSLPELDDGTYQFWGSDGERVISLGVLGADPDVVAFRAATDQDVFMVSLEDEPVEQPTGAPVVSGELGSLS